MVTILFLLLECLKELFLIAVVGGFVAIASAGLVVYILAKLLGVDRLRELAALKDEVDLLLAKEHMHESEDVYFDDDYFDEDDLYYSYLEEDDYILTKDGEKIPYDEDTQE